MTPNIVHPQVRSIQKLVYPLEDSTMLSSLVPNTDLDGLEAHLEKMNFQQDNLFNNGSSFNDRVGFISVEDAFIELKPLCVSILTNGENLLRTVRSFKDSSFYSLYKTILLLNDIQMLELCEFILFPLRNILVLSTRRHCEDGCLDATTKCIDLVFSKLSAQNALPLKEPMVVELLALLSQALTAPLNVNITVDTKAGNMLSERYKALKKLNISDASEDSIINIIEIITNISKLSSNDLRRLPSLRNSDFNFKERSSENQFKIIPVLSHILSLLMDISKDLTKRVGMNTRLIALKCINSVVDLVNKYNPKDVKIFLPGIIGCTTKICVQNRDKENSKIVLEALSIFSKAVTSCFNDSNLTKNEVAILSDSLYESSLFNNSKGTSKEMDQLKSLVMFANNKNDTDKEQEKEKEKLNSYTQWVLDSRPRIYSAIKILIKDLRLVDSYNVKVGLAELCGQILSKSCTIHLSNCTTLVLECLIGLKNDNYMTISDIADKYINMYVDKPDNNHHSFRKSLKDNLSTKLINFFSLTGTLTNPDSIGNDETIGVGNEIKEKQFKLRVINGFLEILSVDELKSVLDLILPRISLGMFNMVKFFPNYVMVKDVSLNSNKWKIDEHIWIYENEDSLDGIQYLLKDYMVNLSTVSTNYYDEIMISLLQTFFRLLGKKCDILSTVEHFRMYLTQIDDASVKGDLCNISEYDTEVFWILCNVLQGYFTDADGVYLKNNDINGQLLTESILKDTMSIIEAHDTKLSNDLKIILKVKNLYTDFSYLLSSNDKKEDSLKYLLEKIVDLSSQLLGSDSQIITKFSSRTPKTGGVVKWKSSKVVNYYNNFSLNNEGLILILSSICKTYHIPFSFFNNTNNLASSLPTSFSDELNLKVCVGLDLISNLQRYVSPVFFMYSLPFCLLRLGSVVFLVNQCAQLAVNRLAQYHDKNVPKTICTPSSALLKINYSSQIINRVIADNSDYIIDKLDWQLRDIKGYPEVLIYLRVLVSLCKRQIAESPLNINLHSSNGPCFGILFESLVKLNSILDDVASDPSATISADINGISYNKTLKDVFDLLIEIFREEEENNRDEDIETEEAFISEFIVLDDEQSEGLNPDLENEVICGMERQQFKSLPSCMQKWALTRDRNDNINLKSDLIFDGKDAKQFFQEYNANSKKEKQDPFDIQNIDINENHDNLDTEFEDGDNPEIVTPGLQLVIDIIERVLNFTSSSSLVGNNSNAFLIQVWNVVINILPSVKITIVNDQVVASVWDVLELSVMKANADFITDSSKISLPVYSSFLNVILACLNTASKSFLSTRINQIIGALLSIYCSLLRTEHSTYQRQLLETITKDLFYLLEIIYEKEISLKVENSRLISNFIQIFFLKDTEKSLPSSSSKTIIKNTKKLISKQDLSSNMIDIKIFTPIETGIDKKTEIKRPLITIIGEDEPTREGNEVKDKELSDFLIREIKNSVQSTPSNIPLKVKTFNSQIKFTSTERKIVNSFITKMKSVGGTLADLIWVQM